MESEEAQDPGKSTDAGKRRPVSIELKHIEENQGQPEPSETDMSDYEKNKSDEPSDESA